MGGAASIARGWVFLPRTLDLTLFVIGVAFMIAGTALAIGKLVIALEPDKAGKGELHELGLTLPAKCSVQFRRDWPGRGQAGVIGQE
jgi:hypothetical protein